MRKQRSRKKIRQTQTAARRLREKHNLCLCGDDYRTYPDDQAADADTAPATICEACKKPKLVVKAVNSLFASPLINGTPAATLAARILQDR